MATRSCRQAPFANEQLTLKGRSLIFVRDEKSSTGEFAALVPVWLRLHETAILGLVFNESLCARLVKEETLTQIMNIKFACV